MDKLCSVAWNWAGMDSSEQAAWVQAVGSVLAILIAIAIPVIGSWWRHRREKREAREQMLNAMLRVYEPITALLTSMEEWHETSDPAYDVNDPIVSTDPHSGQYEKLIPAVIATSAFLEDMGPATPKMRDFLFDVIELDRFNKSIEPISRTGSPGFYRNNLPDIRDRVAAVKTKGDALLAEINKATA